MFSFKFLIILCYIISYTQCSLRKDWVEPDVWARTAPSSNQICGSCECDQHQSQKPNVIESISMIYYKKLLAFLFNRNKLEFNENRNIYNRAILITITDSQIQKLEKSTDPRDWDAIINEILPRIETFAYNEEHKTWWITRQLTKLIRSFKSILSSFELSETRFELFLILAILAIIYVKKMHGLSVAFIVIFGMLVSGYVYKYYECNRQLEIEQLADLYDVQSSNPCGDGYLADRSIWNLWGLLLMKPSKAQCLEYLRKKNKLKLPFCRPDDVLFIYINEMILKQFHLTVAKSTDILKEINRSMPFPYNIVATIIFGATLLSFLKLFFKYILSPTNWYHWGRTKCNTSSHCPGHNEDRLSGDNLKNFLEICKGQIHSALANNCGKLSIVASGVQVLTDCRELIPQNSTRKEEEIVQIIARTKEPVFEKIDESNHNNCMNDSEGGEDEIIIETYTTCASVVDAATVNDEVEILKDVKKEKES